MAHNTHSFSLREFGGGPTYRRRGLAVLTFLLTLLLSGCGEHEGTFSFSGKAVNRLECTLATQSISEQDFGYIIALDTPDSIGADYIDNNGDTHSNCVILYRTHTRFEEGNTISGRMYIDPDYPRAICAYHYTRLGLPEGVCEKLD